MEFGSVCFGMSCMEYFPRCLSKYFNTEGKCSVVKRVSKYRKHAISKKARFPRQIPRVFLIFSPSNYIQVPNPSFFRVLLSRLGWYSKSTLCLLDKVQSKATRLINNPNLTKSLQPLSHRRIVGDLSIFYRYFHGHCSQEIREIIPAPLRRVRTNRSSTHSHLFPSFTA